MLQCSNQRKRTLAETSVVPFPGSPKLPELKLPKLDLDKLFGTQTATLAAVQQAQTVLVEAAQAISRLQHGYVTAVAADAKAALAVKQPPQPAAVLKDCQAVAEKGAAVTKEILDLAIAAQRHAAELLAQRAQATLAELKAVAA
jgi:hypothetical protein